MQTFFGAILRSWPQKEWKNWGDAFTHTFTKAYNTSFLSRVIQIVTARPRVPRLPKKSFKKICTGHRKREEKWDCTTDSKKTWRNSLNLTKNILHFFYFHKSQDIPRNSIHSIKHHTDRSPNCIDTEDLVAIFFIIIFKWHFVVSQSQYPNEYRDMIKKDHGERGQLAEYFQRNEKTKRLDSHI